MVRMTLVIRLSPAQPEIQRINPSHLGVLCLRFAWGLHPRGGPDIPSSAFRPSSLRPDAAVPVLGHGLPDFSLAQRAPSSTL